MQLYALLRFLHWEAHISSLPPHPQRSTWYQRGPWQSSKSQDLLLLCCSHSLGGLHRQQLQSFTTPMPARELLSPPFCNLRVAGKNKRFWSNYVLSASWRSVSGLWNSADCSSPRMSKDSLGHYHSSGSQADALSIQLWDPHRPGSTGLSCSQQRQPGRNYTGTFLHWNDRNALVCLQSLHWILPAEHNSLKCSESNKSFLIFQ